MMLVPIVDACSGSAPGLADRECLGHALGLLLSAAAVLPEEDVPYAVTRRLFDLEHFVGFAPSSPDARGLLLPAGFQLLRVARRRGLPVRCVHGPERQLSPIK